MKARNEDPVLRRFGGVLLRAPKYLLLAGNLARDGRLSGTQKAGAVAAMGYVLSPIDLMPGIIPIAGQLDDLLVLIGALRGVLWSCPPEIARDHLTRAGLTHDNFDEDLSALWATARWVARMGAGLLLRATRASINLLVGRTREGRGAAVPPATTRGGAARQASPRGSGRQP